VRARPPKKTSSLVGAPEPVLEGIDASLLDIVDHVLTKGVVITGDLVLGVADVDLVYLRLSAVLCAADRVLGTSGRSRADRARRDNGLVASRLGRRRGRGNEK
jgi:hypothetical protein